jgi:hypothetical protein
MNGLEANHQMGKWLVLATVALAMLFTFQVISFLNETVIYQTVLQGARGYEPNATPMVGTAIIILLLVGWLVFQRKSAKPNAAE